MASGCPRLRYRRPAPAKATLLDEQLVIYRMQGQVVVARDVCPHRGVPLTLGFHDEEGIICPYHGLRFGEDGRCNRIPSSPDQPVPAKLNLINYAVEERFGLIWTCLAFDADNPAPLPTMPHWDDDGFQQINCPAFEVNGFAGRQVEGFLDVAHFAWIHTDTFADPNNQLVPAYNPLETESGFAVADYWSSVSNFAADSPQQAPEGFSVAASFRDASAVYRHADDSFSRRIAAGDHECRIAGLIARDPHVCAHRAQF